MHDPDLDTSIAARLSRLSTVRAPETLLPRVLAAAQRLAARPWYAQTWDAWPQPYQTASVAICLLVLAAMTLTTPSEIGWSLDDAVALTGGRLEALPGALDEITRIARGAGAVSNTAGSLWQGLSVPLLLYASAIGALLCFVMGLLAVALNRLTPGKALSR
jgi:hypothetical protein